MPGVTESRTFDAYLTSTMDNYRGMLQDQIFDVFPFLSWLNGSLGKGLRGENGSVKRFESGGNRITEQLLYAKNTTARSYAGAEKLDTTLQNGITQAVFNWKQYAVSVGIEGIERRTNTGQQQIINLLKAKITQATMSLRDDLSLGAFSDGTGNNNKDLTGIQTLISDTATAGGLAPGTFDWWKSTSTTSGSFADRGLSDMRNTYNTVSFGNDKPDFIVTTQDVFQFFEDSLVPQERYTNTKFANSGFTGLTFKGLPLLFDRDCPSGTMYMLNSNYISFVVHPDADFSNTPFQTPVGQDVTTSEILFQGNLTVNNRRMHAVIDSITA